MSEIINSAEMKRFEKVQFLKKNSYSFMQKAGKRVFEFIINNFKNKKSITLSLAVLSHLTHRKFSFLRNTQIQQLRSLQIIAVILNCYQI